MRPQIGLKFKNAKNFKSEENGLVPHLRLEISLLCETSFCYKGVII